MVGLGLVVGTICGGVVGAAMLAVPTYFEDGCSILGCAKDWVIIGLYMGLVLGGIPGAIIGTPLLRHLPLKRKASPWVQRLDQS